MNSRFFEKAAVIVSNKGILVNAIYTSMRDKHYNVSISYNVQTGGATIYADKPNFKCFAFGTETSDPEIVNQFKEDSWTYKRKYPLFFWTKKTVPWVEGWCEYKETERVCYQSNNFTLICKA